MLGMLKRHEIKVLLKAGHAQSEVAKLAGVSLRSVKRVVKEGDIEHVDDAAARVERGIGRPSLVQDFRKRVTDLLEKEPGLLSVEVVRRMRLDGYIGQKSALYGLIAAVRPKDQTPLVRFEGLPGEFSQHDFGQVDVEYRDGATQRIRFFASRLKYSRTIRVSLVPDETTETLIRHFADHLQSWGGARGEGHARLRALKGRPDDLALRVPVYVGPTGTVVHDTHPYSMPPEAIGIAGTLYLYRDRVRIVAGRFEVTHARQFVRGEGS